MLKYIKKVGIVFFIVFILFVCCYFEFGLKNGHFDNTKELGTAENPYKIETYDDLKALSEQVNDGESFKDCYFLQTGNIVMEGDNWIPIGNNNNIFEGVYNGNGYTISNLFIEKADNTEPYALFGNVAGVIANVGIESGEINVQNGAAIATNSVGENALIINCYNKASISGNNIAGIALDFQNGDIVCCTNYGNLDATESSFEITACSYNVKIYYCQGIVENIAPNTISYTGSFVKNKEQLLSKINVQKRNIEVALAQYLYAQRYDIQLIEKSIVDGDIKYSEYGLFWYLVRFFNYYFLTTLVILYSIYYIEKLRKLNYEEKTQVNKNMVFVFGTMSIFIDCAICAKGIQNLSIGNIFFIILINILFVMALTSILKNKVKFNPKNISLPFVICMLIVVGLELVQFGLVPKYDGSLYYGSFVEGTNRFNFDLITYIGAFTCWKWIQGLALFIAPFEFIFPGEMIGVYIGNVIITIITAYMFWNILKFLFEKSNTVLFAMATFFLFACPYELGLFSYLNMDSHLALFAVWLIYFKLQKNDVMVAFVGGLLSFTKITGMCFYVFYLGICALFEINQQEGKNIYKKIRYWCSLRTIILWVSPVIIYMFFYIYGGRFTMLNFFGTYTANSVVKFQFDVAVMDVIAQAFGYGFRWVIILVGIILLFLKRGKFQSITEIGKKQYVTVILSSILVVIMLCLYNSDANCPRYTAILNIMYAMIFPLIILEIKSYRMQILAGGISVIVMFIQLFVTIDPLIIYTTESIDLGHTKLYRLALKSDQRDGMAIGKGYALDDYTQCDIFCYNLQFSYADSLINEMLSDIHVNEDDTIYVLDEYEYEFQISGSWHRNYKIYWDDDKKKRTYAEKGNIYVNVKNLSTDDVKMKQQNKDDSFPKSFYVLVPARVNPEQTLDLLESMGYSRDEMKRYDNIYGYFDLYTIRK